MEFKFNLNDIFKQPIVEVNSSMIPPGFSGDRRQLWDTVNKVSEVVNAMGEASANAQGLTKPITTAERLRNSEHKLYLLIDQQANNGKGAITGMLKTGVKGLYVFDREGQHYQVSPPCVLDFYVHESRQRTGLGKHIFEHMLQKEGIEPVKMAIDRPSEKFLGFLNKHYGLHTPVKQMNNYVVFDGFFPKTTESPIPVETDKSITCNKRDSANGLQNYPSSPYGRYGAPRPPCSMGQIIHNTSSTITKRQEPTGVQSMPATNVGANQNCSYLPSNQVSQSTPNISYGLYPSMNNQNGAGYNQYVNKNMPQQYFQQGSNYNQQINHHTEGQQLHNHQSTQQVTQNASQNFISNQDQSSAQVMYPSGQQYSQTCIQNSGVPGQNTTNTEKHQDQLNNMMYQNRYYQQSMSTFANENQSQMQVPPNHYQGQYHQSIQNQPQPQLNCNFPVHPQLPHTQPNVQDDQMPTSQGENYYYASQTIPHQSVVQQSDQSVQIQQQSTNALQGLNPPEFRSELQPQPVQSHLQAGSNRALGNAPIHPQSILGQRSQQQMYEPQNLQTGPSNHNTNIQATNSPSYTSSPSIIQQQAYNMDGFSNYTPQTRSVNQYHSSQNVTSSAYNNHAQPQTNMPSNQQYYNTQNVPSAVSNQYIPMEQHGSQGNDVSSTLINGQIPQQQIEQRNPNLTSVNSTHQPIPSAPNQNQHSAEPVCQMGQGGFHQVLSQPSEKIQVQGNTNIPISPSSSMNSNLVQQRPVICNNQNQSQPSHTCMHGNMTNLQNLDLQVKNVNGQNVHETDNRKLSTQNSDTYAPQPTTGPVNNIQPERSSSYIVHNNQYPKTHSYKPTTIPTMKAQGYVEKTTHAEGEMQKLGPSQSQIMQEDLLRYGYPLQLSKAQLLSRDKTVVIR